MVRIHACHAWGHGFESRTHRQPESYFWFGLFLLHTPLLYNHTSHHLIFKHHLPPSDFIRGNPSNIQPTDFYLLKCHVKPISKNQKKHLHSNILYIYKYTVFIQRYTKQSIFILFNQSFCTYRFTKNKGYSLPFKKKQIQIVTYSFSDHLFSTKVHKTQKYSI